MCALVETVILPVSLPEVVGAHIQCAILVVFDAHTIVIKGQIGLPVSGNAFKSAVSLKKMPYAAEYSMLYFAASIYFHIFAADYKRIGYEHYHRKKA